jgi:hypothetical protein
LPPRWAALDGAAVADRRAFCCADEGTAQPLAIVVPLAPLRELSCRSGDGAARKAIYRTPLTGRRSFIDIDAASGQRTRHAVVALSSPGRGAGLSPVVDTVPLP